MWWQMNTYGNVILRKSPQEFSIRNHWPPVSHPDCSMGLVSQRDFREGISAENNVSDLSSSPVHLKFSLCSIQVSDSPPMMLLFPFPFFNGRQAMMAGNDACLPLKALESEPCQLSSTTDSKISFLITWCLSFPICKCRRNSTNIIKFKGLNGVWKVLSTVTVT